MGLPWQQAMQSTSLVVTKNIPVKEAESTCGISENLVKGIGYGVWGGCSVKGEGERPRSVAAGGGHHLDQ